MPFAIQGTVAQTRVATFLWPSEINEKPTVTPTVTLSPTNDGTSTGTWWVWDPVTQAKGDGAFAVDQSIRPADFNDGMSNTLGMAEVKTYLGVMHDGLNTDVVNAPVPATPARVIALGGAFTPNSTRAAWVYGIMPYTAVFP